MAKGPRVIITLECTEARKIGKSPSRYTTTKNKKTHPERLELKKYNPALRKHFFRNSASESVFHIFLVFELVQNWLVES